ncbi:DUF3040 domain-containing protein [Streptomyces sp. NRRL S-87]|uniref:DUF3040 domain-containing protein n=1 Tax=Streptomyces sp. NRRL S-87 TaxID=1463920 RepID=UPI00068A3A4B|nr:DUF3040 domain-containing protein [Streptomyces sp. NRRL S-87]
MDGSDVPEDERTVLTEIEQGLRGQDPRLDHRLRTMRMHRCSGPWHTLRRHRLGAVAWLLGAASVALFVLAVSAPEPALIWAFAAMWALTLGCLLKLVVAWCRRWAATLGRQEPRSGSRPPARS